MKAGSGLMKQIDHPRIGMIQMQLVHIGHRDVTVNIRQTKKTIKVTIK
jgi:hypothetical protein